MAFLSSEIPLSKGKQPNSSSFTVYGITVLFSLRTLKMEVGILSFLLGPCLFSGAMYAELPGRVPFVHRNPID